MESFSKSFYYVRHGETDWNKNYIYQGQNDILLNEKGREQAQKVSAKIKAISDIDAIFASPLLRAKETAQIISKALPDLPLNYVEELKEVKSRETAEFILEEKGIRDKPSLEKVPFGVESPAAFLERIKVGLGSVLNSDTQYPLIVAHGGVCFGLFKILDLPLLQTPNCCLLKFEKLGKKYFCEAIG